jgi:oxygen-independent coproporphyrinogen III oxidase
MRLLAGSPEKIDVEQLIADGTQGDYIYMYPPRQAYREMPEASLTEHLRTSFAETADEPLNLYVHFPFCRQICGFCNLYSVPASQQEPFADYVDLLIREVDQWVEWIAGRRVDTLYLGGGTPSLLPVAELDRCIEHIERTLGVCRDKVPEVAIEVAPDTVDRTKLKDLHRVGINRVNLGLQTTSDDGLHRIGRRHGFALAKERIEDALSTGFSNVCVDLIYGLADQSVDQWRGIVEDVLRFGAPTVCAYPLTLRPNTGFARRGMEVPGASQYERYEVARDLLTARGYVQETHVRYVIAGRGGYQQKRNHWAGQDILGIGAGARGYLRHCDYRNGYSIRRRRDALDAYRTRILAGRRPYVQGIPLSADERMRRYVILGLLDLDLAGFTTTFGADATVVFADQIAELRRLGMIDVRGATARLTRDGRKYRDLLVQLFFSQQVWDRVTEFDYLE